MEATQRRPAGDVDSATLFTLELGRALGRAGAETEQLEETMAAIAAHVGLDDPQVFVRPTAITIATGPLGNQRSTSVRVAPGVVDLGQITRLTKVAVDVQRDALSVDAATERVHAIEGKPSTYAWPTTTLAYVLASASVAAILGGGRVDVVAAGAIGLVTGVAARAAVDLGLVAFAAPAAATLAAFLATSWAGLHDDISPGLVTLAGVVVFLPGVALTVGLRELSTAQLMSGVGNLATAGVTLLGLIFGVAVGTGMAEHWFGSAGTGALESRPTIGVATAAAVVAGVSLTVRNNADPRDAGWMIAASVVAILGSRLFTHFAGSPAGSFFAALAVGIAGNLFTRLTARPSLVFVAPGLVMLVPGSAGFFSLAELLDSRVQSAIHSAFEMFIVAIAIAYGLSLSNLLVRPRPFR